MLTLLSGVIYVCSEAAHRSTLSGKPRTAREEDGDDEETREMRRPEEFIYLNLVAEADIGPTPSWSDELATTLVFERTCLPFWGEVGTALIVRSTLMAVIGSRAWWERGRQRDRERKGRGK